MYRVLFCQGSLKKCPYKHTLFIKITDEGKILIVCFYVDDFIFTGNDEIMFKDFKRSMMVEFYMTDLGKISYFLGIEVMQRPDGVFIDQRKYEQEVLDRFNMDQCNSMHNLIVPRSKLMKDEDEVRVDNTLYKLMVRSLMYLTTTRLDIMIIVSLISKYVERSTEMHLQAAKRVLRYMKGTISFGAFCKKRGIQELMGYTDNDYVGD